MKTRLLPGLFAVFALIIAGCAEEARQKEEQLLCEDVKTGNTIEGYDSYLEKYPKGRCSAEVLSKLDPLLWQNAEKKDTIESYDYYLKRIPAGTRVSEAKEKKDRLLCKKVRKENTADSYDSYIKQYPDGICAAEFKKKLELIVWKDAMKKGTPDAYDSYIKKFPNGVYTSEAKNKRTKILFIQLRSSKQETRTEAANKLSGIGGELSESDVKKIIDIMRNGKEKWETSRFRPEGHHCTDYTYTSIRYYAAAALSGMQSPYVTKEIVREAVKTRSSSTKTERVTDPGWI